MAKERLQEGDIVKDGREKRLRGRVVKVEYQPSVQGRGVVEEIYVDWMVGSDRNR